MKAMAAKKRAKKSAPAKAPKKKRRTTKPGAKSGNSRELAFLLGHKDLDTPEKRRGIAEAIAEEMLEWVDELRKDEGLPPLK